MADEFVSLLVKLAKERKIGPPTTRRTELARWYPRSTASSSLIGSLKASKRVPKLVLDGRGVVVPGYEGRILPGAQLCLTVSKPGMTVGDSEIFGPVTCVKRVKDFRGRQDLAVMNS